jgi:hypothetical protein
LERKKSWKERKVGKKEKMEKMENMNAMDDVDDMGDMNAMRDIKDKKDHIKLTEKDILNCKSFFLSFSIILMLYIAFSTFLDFGQYIDQNYEDQIAFLVGLLITSIVAVIVFSIGYEKDSIRSIEILLALSFCMAMGGLIYLFSIYGVILVVIASTGLIQLFIPGKISKYSETIFDSVEGGDPNTIDTTHFSYFSLAGFFLLYYSFYEFYHTIQYFNIVSIIALLLIFSTLTFGFRKGKNNGRKKNSASTEPLRDENENISAQKSQNGSYKKKSLLKSIQYLFTWLFLFMFIMIFFVKFGFISTIGTTLSLSNVLILIKTLLCVGLIIAFLLIKKLKKQHHKIKLITILALFGSILPLVLILANSTENIKEMRLVFYSISIFCLPIWLSLFISLKFSFVNSKLTSFFRIFIGFLIIILLLIIETIKDEIVHQSTTIITILLIVLISFLISLITNTEKMEEKQ